MGDLSEQVIVITGASAGIGAACAREAARRGARLVLVARREPELAALADELGGAARALPVVADVAVRADNVRVVERAIATFGHVDAFVANAGRGITRGVLELTDDDVDEMTTINVKSLVYAAQAVVPHFIARERGYLLYVSSMLARIPFAPFRSAYSAAKAAATSLATSLRLELRAKHPAITVGTFFPGVVATEFGIKAKHGGPDSRQLPNAQPVDEVGAAIAALLAAPRAEGYSRPGMREMAARYYAAEDVATVEVGPPFPTAR